MNYKGLIVYILIIITAYIAKERPLILLLIVPFAVFFYKKLIRKEYRKDIIEERSVSVIKSRYPEDDYLLFPYLNSKEYKALHKNNTYYTKLSFRFDTAVRENYEKYKKDFAYNQTIKLQDLDNLETYVKGIASFIIVNCHPKDTKFLSDYFKSDFYADVYEKLSDLTIFNDVFAGLILENYREYKENLKI